MSYYLFYLKDGNEFSACAAGQGLLNIGWITKEKATHRIRATINRHFNAKLEYEGQQYIDSIDDGLLTNIYRLNDRHGLTCQQIAERLRSQ